LTSCRFPYTYISDHVIRNTPNLREKFDVILFPPGRWFGADDRERHADAWRSDAVERVHGHANFGNSPDQTADMRGGMTVAGVANLQKFIEDGGLFITIGDCCSSADRLRHHHGVSIQPADKLQARGSIYNSTFSDRKSPIAYGYDAGLPIYFNQAPLLQVAAAAVAVVLAVAAVVRAVARTRVRDAVALRSGRGSGDATAATCDPNNRPDPDQDRARVRSSCRRSCARASCCVLRRTRRTF
jgi:hypothetical protein